MSSRQYFLTVALLAGLIVRAFPAYAQTEVVSVKAEGSATTKSLAVTSALVQAISMVNGVAIAAQNATSIRENFQETDEGSDFSSSESFSSDINSRMAGVVDSWRLLDAQQMPDLQNLWVVNLEAKIIQFKQSGQLKRLRLIVFPIRVGPDVRDRKLARQFGRAFAGELQDHLTQSRRFAMLDREFLEEQGAELDFITGEGVTTGELARLGNRIGTDYIVVGEVEKASIETTERQMETTNQTLTFTKTSGRAMFRIIDVATTQVKFSDTMSISATGDAVIGDLARTLANRSGETILNAIFPIRVVAIDGDRMTLGQGGTTVQEGRLYKIVRLGKWLVDPYTKEAIGREEVDVGEAKVVSVQSKISSALITSQTGEIPQDLSTGTLIIRPINDIDNDNRQGGTAAQEKVDKVTRKGRDAIEDMTDDDM